MVITLAAAESAAASSSCSKEDPFVPKGEYVNTFIDVADFPGGYSTKLTLWYSPDTRCVWAVADTSAVDGYLYVYNKTNGWSQGIDIDGTPRGTSRLPYLTQTCTLKLASRRLTMMAARIAHRICKLPVEPRFL